MARISEVDALEEGAAAVFAAPLPPLPDGVAPGVEVSGLALELAPPLEEGMETIKSQRRV